MKVIYFGTNSDFESDTGEGSQRYGYNLYKMLNNMVNIQLITASNRLGIIKEALFYKFESEIIHITNFRLLYPIRRNKDSIIIVTAHDFQPLLYPEFSHGANSSLNTKIWFLLVKWGLHELLKADYLLCNSSQTKEEAIKLGFDKNRLFVVNHGIDKRFMIPIHPKKDKDKFIVGYLGAMRKRKNLELGINAANAIKSKDIFFDIWGKKDFEYEYLVSISKNKNINFKGFAPEEKIVNIYDSFDVFIFPSYHEGEGLPILEAQSRGLPVIIYKYGKIPKEVRKYCFEAESPEHMAQIIENLKENGYNEKLKKKATEYARSFTWGKCAKGTLEIYKKVLKK